MWILTQERCVGCGNELKKGTLKKVKGKNTITCKCNRVYIKEKNSYRRAQFNEV